MAKPPPGRAAVSHGDVLLMHLRKRRRWEDPVCRLALVCPYVCSKTPPRFLGRSLFLLSFVSSLDSFIRELYHRLPPLFRFVSFWNGFRFLSPSFFSSLSFRCGNIKYSGRNQYSPKKEIKKSCMYLPVLHTKIDIQFMHPSIFEGAR